MYSFCLQLNVKQFYFKLFSFAKVHSLDVTQVHNLDVKTVVF